MFIIVQFRSSHRRCSVKKDVLKNFANFTAKHLCLSLFIRKRLQHKCFLVKFGKFFRTPILKNIHERLFLAVLFYEILLQLLTRFFLNFEPYQTKTLDPCLKLPKKTREKQAKCQKLCWTNNKRKKGMAKIECYSVKHFFFFPDLHSHIFKSAFSI